MIILDHRELVLTHPVLTICAQLGIALFSTGQDHLTDGVFLSFLQNSRQSKSIHLQQNLKKHLVKQAWTSIIQAKIFNQAQCLLLTANPSQQTATLLIALVKKVRSKMLTM